jgi:hypothetical protein
VQLITGIGRSMIDRTWRLQQAEGPSMGHLEAVMITDTGAGTLPFQQSAWSESGGSGI